MLIGVAKDLLLESVRSVGTRIDRGNAKTLISPNSTRRVREYAAA